MLTKLHIAQFYFKEGVIAPRWWSRVCLALLPSQELLLIPIWEQDTTERVLQQGGEVEAPSAPEPQRDHIRRVREVATSWLHCPSPGQCTQTSADGVHTHGAWVIIPTSGFAYLQNQVGGHSDQGTWESADLPDSNPQGVLRALEPSLAMHRQEVTAPSAMESVIWPQLSRRAGDTPWKICNAVALKLRSRQSWRLTGGPAHSGILGEQASLC